MNPIMAETGSTRTSADMNMIPAKTMTAAMMQEQLVLLMKKDAEMSTSSKAAPPVKEAAMKVMKAPKAAAPVKEAAVKAMLALKLADLKEEQLSLRVAAAHAALATALAGCSSQEP